MPNFSSTSTSADYFTPQQSGEQNLWQLEGNNRSNCDESIAIEIADNLPLHLLPFDHSGKITNITPLQVLMTLKK